MKITKMDNEQNAKFMSDPERLAAEQRMRDLVKHIQASVKTDGSAEYYLTVLPPILKQLEEARQNLATIEVKVQDRILGLIK